MVSEIIPPNGIDFLNPNSLEDRERRILCPYCQLPIIEKPNSNGQSLREHLKVCQSKAGKIGSFSDKTPKMPKG